MLTPPRPGVPLVWTPAAMRSPTAGATAQSPPPLAAQRRPSLSPHAPPPPAQSQARPVCSPSDTRVWCTASAPLWTSPPPGAPLRWTLVVTLSLTSTASVPPPAPVPHQPQQPPQQQQLAAHPAQQQPL